MKYLFRFFSLATCLLWLPVSFSADDGFAAFKRQQQQQSSAYNAQVDKEFKAYKKALQQAFGDYRKKVGKVWGAKDEKLPNRSTHVEYGNNLSERRVVDLENGVVEIEIALDAKELKDQVEVQKRVARLLINTLNQAPDQRSIIDIAKKPEMVKRKGKPLLADMVKTADGKAVTEKNAAKFAVDVVKKGVKKRKVVGDDGKKRTIVSVNVPLVPDHIKRRAVKYRSQVKKYANEQDLQPELIFALMETESFFNPTAKSHVPAFGLMQLVPTSGARDAYRYLFKSDKVVRDTFLYNPDNNVRMGAAYMHILFYSYLKGVKDKEARLWCAIAAYNTGAGNVFRTFAGKYSKSRFGSRKVWKNQALDKINSQSAEEIYQTLRGNLPYEETRNYIKKVRERMPKYRSMT